MKADFDPTKPVTVRGERFACLADVLLDKPIRPRGVFSHIDQEALNRWSKELMDAVTCKPNPLWQRLTK